MNLKPLFNKAIRSSYHRFLLELGLRFFIPFNNSHRFKIDEIEAYALKIRAPYRRSNLNHLKGIHACAMATIAEVSSGLLLISILDDKKYRLILQKLELNYLYQAKTAAVASFKIDENWLKERVIDPLESSDRVFVDCQIIIEDTNGTKVADALARWQIKNWSAVKTKV
jgi:acyl-coenzyme A thioesterase PaaI-like protein